jgi:hypothetical protein
MRAARAGRAAACALALAGAWSAAGALEPRASDAVARRLQAAGGARVEAVQRAEPDGPGRADSVRLAITLRPPGYLRVEHADRSHALVLRPDGGELLDHRLRQLVRLDAAQAARAAGVWRLFLTGSGRLGERRLGPGRFAVLIPAEGESPAESVWVALGPDSLPRRLEIGSPPSLRLDFSRWRFGSPAPLARFRLAAPPGYAVVDWP